MALQGDRDGCPRAGLWEGRGLVVRVRHQGSPEAPGSLCLHSSSQGPAGLGVSCWQAREQPPLPLPRWAGLDSRTAQNERRWQTHRDTPPASLEHRKHSLSILEDKGKKKNTH